MKKKNKKNKILSYFRDNYLFIHHEIDTNNYHFILFFFFDYLNYQIFD